MYELYKKDHELALSLANNPLIICKYIFGQRNWFGKGIPFVYMIELSKGGCPNCHSIQGSIHWCDHCGIHYPGA